MPSALLSSLGLPVRAAVARACLAALFALGSVSGTVQAQQADRAEAGPEPVLFLTSRNRVEAETPGERFGDERSTMRAGVCRVRDFDLGGLAGLAEQAPSFLREELMRVSAVTEEEQGALLDRLQTSAGDAGAVLYVHGYNISFDKGCRRAALLQRNTGTRGRLLWFSWPSDGALAFYTRDEADLYWSVPDLSDTLIALDRRFGPGQVDVIGHSLGGRGVVLALYDLANRHPDIRLGHVVLAAPDIDFGIFERILPRLTRIAASLTVYVSDGDRPLALSEQVHGYPRLGAAGNDVGRLPGVEVVDLSAVRVNDPTGHLFHIYSAEVGEDMERLLDADAAANARPDLVRAGENLWKLMPRKDGEDD